MNSYIVTTESVCEGHPDKICDQISDAILDEILTQDKYGRVACETFITRGVIIIGGEITTKASIDANKIARDVVKDIGYNKSELGFHWQTCGVLNVIGKQSPDIAQGVDRGGAGDQGCMIGYACNETSNYMPLAYELARKLVMRLDYTRKEKILPYLGPDGKSQVTLKKNKDGEGELVAVVISAQHTEEIVDPNNPKSLREDKKEEIIKEVALKVIPKELISPNTKFFVNPTGRFVIGGPLSDTGMTGRKIIVDTYGTLVPHGGGAFSGKDPTKVDRSSAYMARYLAKNVVAAGIAKECIIQLSYIIGESQPISFLLETNNTSKVEDVRIRDTLAELVDLTPQGIIEFLDLRKPIYRNTSIYGHFGREDQNFNWEKIDLVDTLKEKLL
jgi:S-adenosylmethionine synthetase